MTYSVPRVGRERKCVNGVRLDFHSSIAPNPARRHKGRSPCGSDEIWVTITGDEIRVTKTEGSKGVSATLPAMTIGGEDRRQYPGNAKAVPRD